MGLKCGETDLGRKCCVGPTGAIRSGRRCSRRRIALALMKTPDGEKIWKAGKQETQNLAAFVPAFLLSRLINSSPPMAPRRIADLR